MRLRKSEIEAFIRCPHLYELLYIKRLPIVASIEMKIGKTFHEFAKNFFGVIDYDKLQKINTSEKAFELFTQTLECVPQLVEPLCLNFLHFEAKRWSTLKVWYEDPLRYFKPLATELYYEVSDIVPGVDGYGHVDRIDVTSKNTLAVVEYKTTKKVHVPSLKRELTWYVLSLEKAGLFDKPFTHICCYNPRIDEEFSANVTRQLRQIVRRRLLQLKRAHEINFFPRHESFLCRWCPALNICIEERNSDETRR